MHYVRAIEILHFWQLLINVFLVIFDFLKTFYLGIFTKEAGSERKLGDSHTIRTSQIPRRGQFPGFVDVDVPWFVVEDLLHPEALLQHAQEVCVPLVADLTGQQHHGGLRAQVLQSLQQRDEGVLQVHDVGPQHQVEAAGRVALQALAPAQL